MKIPAFHSGPVQSLQGVDPAVYRELGRSQVAFGNAISEAGEAVTDQYVRVSTADRLAGEAALRVKDKELRNELMRSEYTPVSDIPPDMRDERFIQTHTNEDGTTTEVIPTRMIADVMYQRTMDEYAKQVQGKARTKLAGEWIGQSYQSEIAPAGRFEVAELVYRQEQVAARVQVDEAVSQLVRVRDREGVRKTIEGAKLNGIITSDVASEALSASMREIAIDEYATEMRNDWSSAENLARLEQEIETDPDLTGEDKTRLKGQLKKTVYYQQEKMVNDAVVEGDGHRLRRMKAMYSSNDYAGPLDGTERARIVRTIDGGLKALEKAAEDQVNMAYFDAINAIDNREVSYADTKAIIDAGYRSGQFNEPQYKTLIDRMKSEGKVSDQDSRLQVSYYLANPQEVNTPEKLAGVVADPKNANFTQNDIIGLQEFSAKLQQKPVQSERQNTLIESAMLAGGFEKPSGAYDDDHAPWVQLKSTILTEVMDAEREKGRALTHVEVRDIADQFVLGSYEIKNPWYKPDESLSIVDMDAERAGRLPQVQRMLSDLGIQRNQLNMVVAERVVEQLRDEGVTDLSTPAAQQMIRDRIRQWREERVSDAD